MGVRRAHEHRSALSGQRQVVGIMALPAHQPQVLVARHRPADIGPAPRRRLARTAMAGGHSFPPDFWAAPDTCGGPHPIQARRPLPIGHSQFPAAPARLSLRSCAADPGSQKTPTSVRSRISRHHFVLHRSGHTFRHHGAADIVRRMNIVEKAPAATPSTGTDFERFRLRRFVESLPDGELEVHDEPLDLADVAPALEGNARAVLFRAAGPERQELVANVAGGRTRLAHAFGVEPRGLVAEIQRRLRNTPQVFEISRAQAPVQQIVLTGDEADLTKLPVHLGHGADGGPYISASVDFAIDPRSGITNVGMRRLMLRGTARDRHRSRLAERSARDLRGERRGRQAAAGELRGRRTSGRSGRRHDAAAGRRDRPALGAARRAAAGGQMRHQRHPRAGRRRVGAGGLPRSARARRARRAVRRVPRLLRRAQAQPGVPPHRDHAPAATRCSRRPPSAAARSAAPTPRSSPGCAPR